MRILQVRFKNLNSLVGEWSVDLDHPAYCADGIFAITGPTGAGKTTLLDAVCLALYGRTPRLARITKGLNEIMSRQTGECFAEATFSTQVGRFRCHWSQHRARRKPDGDLQPPKHEISDAVSGAIFETSLRGVAEQIEAVTGMDFDRFTRSMLLAQGGFAAFLQATPDERAPILEQITGTEQYSRISMAVHERWGNERRQLALLQAELAGIRPLDAEQEHFLLGELTEKRRQEAQLAEQLTGKKMAIAWLDTIDALEEEHRRIMEGKRQLDNRQQLFAPERQKLERAIRALELTGDHRALVSVRNELRKEQQQLEHFRALLPDLEKAVAAGRADLDKASKELFASREGQQAIVAVSRRVRQLDAEIREKNEVDKTIAAAIESRERQRTRLSVDLDRDQNDMAAKQADLDALLRLLEETADDEGLVAEYSGIVGHFATLVELHQRKEKKRLQINEAEDQRAVARGVMEKQEALLTRRLEIGAAKRQSVAEKRQERDSLLQNRDLPAWRQIVVSLTEQHDRLSRFVEATRTSVQTQQLLDDLKKRQDECAADRERTAGQLREHLAQQERLEKEYELLETRLASLRNIEALEASRRQLQEGRPCPLCGAREHPYARQQPPVPDETRRQVEASRSALKAGNERAAELRIRLAELAKDTEHVVARQQEQLAVATEAQRRIAAVGPEFSLAGDVTDMGERAVKLLHRLATEREEAARVVTAAEEVVRQLAGLQEELDSAAEEAALSQREMQDARYQTDSIARQVMLLREDLQQLQHQYDDSLERIQENVAPYQVLVNIDRLEPIREQLRTRRDNRLARKDQAAALARVIDTLQVQIRHQRNQLQQTNEELAATRVQQNELHRQRSALVQQRRELFAERDPDAEERRSAEAVATAETIVEQTRRTLHEVTRDGDAVQAGIATLEKSLVARSRQVHEAQVAFSLRLSDAGFADEAVFEEASLAEAERITLAERAQQLADEQAALVFREREVIKLLAVERAREIGVQSREELRQAVSELTDAQRLIQQEIGAVQQKLQDNESLKEQQADRCTAVANQQRECSCWDNLHELIGSADGKKYRNFAQGLTFELMVGHANRQLRKMSDRYLLIRDDQHPLELNVVDNYQAGEVRSTKNLSGGEGFIVSLALALGLSHMASRKVRVDSLFLDEGFGTLDDEALDTALETLASLQQDGKLIGIISHVPALRERIATRIQVIPETGGRSRITGPGCSRLD